MTILDACGRLLPCWLRYFLVGIALSLVVAVVHWFCVESEVLPRPTDNPALRDLECSEWYVLAAHGFTKRSDGDICVLKYGWPVSNWASIFDNQQPRSIYFLTSQHAAATNQKVHEYYKSTGMVVHWDAAAPASRPSLLAGDISRVWRIRSTGDPFQRAAPLFPLGAHTVAAGAIWGMIAWVVISGRGAIRRLVAYPKRCVSCGYLLVDRNGELFCPECGPARSSWVSKRFSRVSRRERRAVKHVEGH
jgi:hypothetical protein